jgi:hypothetical protein
MLKIIFLFIFLISTVQILLSEFQRNLLYNQSAFLSGVLFLSSLTIGLFFCLVTLKSSDYKLSYLRSMLICLLVLIPVPFITAAFWQVKYNDVGITMDFNVILNLYLLPIISALFVSLFFRR